MDDNVGRRSPRSLSPERRPSNLPQSDHTRDPGGEEFLFHLFRGSELLQDSRVHEAKEELEQALLLQPRDPKGQDLLAVVYFRIGHYPRAIQIYEELKRDHPGRTSLSLNLALCYLKTGQAQLAREELEDVVRTTPDHRRAWGYLGLAYQRLGDYEKAELAFERGGHAAMARRMTQRRAGMPSIVSIPAPSLGLEKASVAPSSSAPTEIPSFQVPKSEHPAPAEGETNGEAAPTKGNETFEELDSGELSFSLAQPETRRPEAEMWHPVEIGEAIKALRSPPPSRPAAVFRDAPAATPDPVPPETGPVPLAQLLLRARVGASPGRTLATSPDGPTVLDLRGPDKPAAFALRFDALRGYTGTLGAAVLERRGRVAHGSFGGISSAVMHVTGDGLLLLSSRPGRTAFAAELGEGDVLFLREDAVLAFDLAMTFENGRLPSPSPSPSDANLAGTKRDEPFLVVQLHGPGPVVFEGPQPLCALDVTDAHSATVRAPSILGWTGRLVPAAIPAGEAPGGQRGLISFVGTGTVLVAGR